MQEVPEQRYLAVSPLAVVGVGTGVDVGLPLPDVRVYDPLPTRLQFKISVLSAFLTTFESVVEPWVQSKVTLAVPAAWALKVMVAKVPVP
jgi:hypothetical protein